MYAREPAAPRWATPRSPDRPTFGPAVGQVAAALGKPLQAWQQQVHDVALELVPDPQGQLLHAGARWAWAYPVVVVHVQRQAGKTTLLGPKNVHRCLTRAGVKCWFTAQSRQDARDSWRDVAEAVARSPLASLLTVRRSNGSEELAVAATGSTFRVFAPSEDALHGKANESVDVDEPWAFDGAQGMALEQAILPTFSTTGGQLWLTSTAGTAASTWFRGYVDRGRAAVESGQRQGIAYFEWSLTPAAADLVGGVLTELARAGGKLDAALAARLDQAIAATLAAHPGEFVKAAAVRTAALTMAPGEFLRAFGNVWTLTADSVISDHAWKAGRRPSVHDPEPLPMPEPGALQLAFDVDVDRKLAGIGVAWHHGTVPALDVIDARPGTAWLVERIEQLAQRWGCATVGFDPVGPAVDIADQLRRRGVVEPVPITTADYAAACAGLLAAVDGSQLLHRGTPALDDAVAAAARRDLGDRWVWSRRNSAGSIAGLVACTVALWQLDHRPPPAAAPVIVATPERDREHPPPPDAALVPAARRRSLIL
jgi:hypothetical protein